MDTNGTEESVLYREVSSFQEWYIVGVEKGVLFREVSSVQGCPYRGVPLYDNVSNQKYKYSSEVPNSYVPANSNDTVTVHAD